MKNFKVVSTATFICLSILTAKAQNKSINDKPAMEFGIKAGITSGSAGKGFRLFSDESTKVGFNAGVFLRTGGRLYFQPEVNLIAFTSEFNFNSIRINGKSRELNIPLMVGYKLMDSETIDIRLSAGPEVNYSLKEDQLFKNFDSKKTTVGALINAGVDFGSFTFDARFSQGITSVYKQENQKLKVYSASIGYKF